jgi:hypothetical protein
MSGGHWDYLQHRLTDVVEDIDEMINKNGKAKTDEEMEAEPWLGPNWYEEYPKDKFHYKYPDEIIEEFKRGARIIAEAEIYMQRIDWLWSGDDGNESFLRRLKDDLQKLNTEESDSTNSGLVSLDEHNSNAWSTQTRWFSNEPIPNGIACPKCGNELMDTNPMMTLTSYPAQKDVHCPKCEYKGYRIV